jgi:hypothetical protein
LWLKVDVRAPTLLGVFSDMMSRIIVTVQVAAPEMADTSNSNVQELRPYELLEWQEEDKAAGEAGEVRFALIELMTLWSPPSQFFAPE